MSFMNASDAGLVRFVRGVLATVPAMLLSLSMSAGDRPEYAVQKIPPELLRNTGAVYRLHEINFEVKDDHRASMRVTDVITVLKEEERDEGVLTIGYDRFHTISDLDGDLYDTNGEKIRSLGKADVKDYSAISGYSLYEDARVQTVHLYHHLYPYTVQLTYEITYDGYLGWPVWYAQPTDHPIEESRFIVTMPTAMPLRSWCNNDSVQPKRTEKGSSTTYEWRAAMLPSLPDDLKHDLREDVTTVVRIAPAHFTLDDFAGDLTSWKSFGEWQRKLFVGRNKLPASAVKQVDSVVRGIDNTRAKVSALYQFLQSRTRYVSVQLGIGGWQPFEAEYVHDRGYGDCKALSNYMVSLLAAAGIVAYPVLTNNGTYAARLRSDFPSWQFNHMIVCVPADHDSVWLECTSQSMPFGHLGESNENRDALLITDQGGVIVHVPASSSSQNFQRRTARVVLDYLGSADAAVVTSLGGDKQDYLRHALADATPLEKQEWITNEVSIPNMKLAEYSTKGFETLSMHLSLPRYASISGERLFFNPNLMERITYVPPERSVKRSPVRFPYSYLDVDSVTYPLPFKYTCEALPAPTVMTASFGSFSSTTSSVGDSVIIFRRTLEITQPEVASDHYSEYRNFFRAVVKADRGQVVLVRKH